MSIDKNTKKISNIASDVYRKLGSGHSESVYDKAMQVGLRLAGIKYESQKVVELTYKNYYVGEGFPDLIVIFPKVKIVVELKAISGKIGVSEERQILNYMEILGIKKGLLINFSQPRKAGTSKIELKEVKL